MRNHQKLVLILILLSCACVARDKADDQSLTFVQITDAHLFDSGKRGANPEIERIDTRVAWDWAILEINRLVVSGKKIDFVVFTGDFGLEKLQDCTALERGATVVADDFSNLLVRTIYLVRGNNDLRDEDPKDAGRFDTFVRYLADALNAASSKTNQPPTQILNLTPSPQPDQCPATVTSSKSPVPYEKLKGIWIVGLDSSSFKNSYPKDEFCKRTTGDLEWQKALPGRYQLELEELERVEKFVLSNPDPKILFTHVPDLDDPYLAEKCKAQPTSWHLNTDARHVWDNITPTISKSTPLLAVFAGHLHDHNPWKYLHPYDWQATPKPPTVPAAAQGNSNQARNLKLEEITYLTPPLAAKLQLDKSSQARGLRVTTITSKGDIKSEIVWFSTAVVHTFIMTEAPINPNGAGKGCECLLLVVVAISFLAVLIVVMVMSKLRRFEQRAGNALLKSTQGSREKLE